MHVLDRIDPDLEAARGNQTVLVQTEQKLQANVEVVKREEDAISEVIEYAEKGVAFVLLPFWSRIKRDKVPTSPPIKDSLYAIFIRSWYNVLFVTVPLALAWASHFKVDEWSHNTTFVLCFIAMIPLQKIFDWGGEEMGEFLGKEPRDLLVITLSNAIEAALAVILLFKCQLRLLQSTVIGVVLLHLLLIPGVAFFVQGVQMYEQKLGDQVNLNYSLLMIGVLAMLVPTVFFAALDRGSVVAGPEANVGEGLPPALVPLVSDAVRHDILRMSRGISIMLLIIYVTSCLWRHNVLPIPVHLDKEGHAVVDLEPSPIHDGAEPDPQDEGSASHNHFRHSHHLHLNHRKHKQAQAHEQRHSRGHIHRHVTVSSPRLNSRSNSSSDSSSSSSSGLSSSSSSSSKSESGREETLYASEVNPWVCALILIVTVALMAPTAEFLVSSLEGVLETSDIQTEWVGLVLLPIVSFSADGVVVVWNFSVACCRHFLNARTSGHKYDENKSQLSTTILDDTRAPLVDEPCAMNVSEDDGATRPALGRAVPNAHALKAETSTSAIPVANVRAATGVDTLNQGVPANPNATATSRGNPTASFTADTNMNAPPPTKPLINLDIELPWASEFAHGRPIDLSIQFTLWWTPFLVLLGWWTERPMHLLFDYFEIAMLLGACFLVNYVMVDQRTNLSEGLTMISFYAMIATAAWFYPGQPQVEFMLNCPGSVAEAVAHGVEGSGATLLVG